MIRVAVNLTWLRPGLVGGSEEYSIRLLEAVVDRAPGDIELRLLGSRALRAAHPALALVPFVVVPGPVGRRAYRLAAESTIVHRATRDADVVHHFGGRLPARCHGNDIVTIHDLQPLHLPENFSAVKRRYLGWALPRSATGARLICTPTQWVADTVAATFAIAPTRLRVVPSTYGPDGPVDTTVADSLGSGPIILYPAITHPHKNHRVLIDAMDRLSERHPDLVLVLTGGAGRSEAAVAAQIAALAGTSRARVVRTGRVTEAVLRGLVARAALLAFPSRYEGFGLPVLEAMRAGIPTVVSDATALPEVVGDAALTAGSDDLAGWVRQIDLMLSDPVLRDRLRTAGRLRAEHFAPERCADRLLAVWREAV